MNNGIIHRILAIDYGSKRIGLALSDPLLIFSYAYKTILNDDKFWFNLDCVIREKEVDTILLGIPYQENGNLASNAPSILKFKEAMAKRYSIEIVEWDESQSSERAKEIIIQTVPGKKKRKDKGLIDRGSASIILQEYLDSLIK
ncbi:MAG: Holliday junction resolvase RuvX [Ignavibacteriaceae bacterium]|nr:Holliday junction resolvase RuvX [Ignavibacteriaceae bacterium]